ncbi:unnamed protein product [Zymoseptoria tritici ST99CH_1E4]|uniref:Uncharacterized protein n=1 Tax=Zymoseptoria tritici ST99CH_1E4 TaxID=1276532 RepID=A0A2H1GYG2_ZYMTR|nr:unnamed protein product [Zymoseptoria tritici ST99CH_1E4]
MSHTPEPAPDPANTLQRDSPHRERTAETEIKDDDTSQVDASDNLLPPPHQTDDITGHHTSDPDNQYDGSDLLAILDSGEQEESGWSAGSASARAKSSEETDNRSPHLEDSAMDDAPEVDMATPADVAGEDEAFAELLEAQAADTNGADAEASEEMDDGESDHDTSPQSDNVAPDVDMDAAASSPSDPPSTEPTELQVDGTKGVPAAEMPPPRQLNLGSSMLKPKKVTAQEPLASDPTSTPSPMSNQQKCLAKQKRLRDKFFAQRDAARGERIDSVAGPSALDSHSSGMAIYPPPGSPEAMDAAAETFRRRVEEFMRKERAGTVMPDERIAFMREQAAERARVLKMKADAAFSSESEDDDDDEDDDEDEHDESQTASQSGLFVTESPAPKATKQRGRKRKAGESVDGNGKASSKKTPAKKRAKTGGGGRKGYRAGDVDAVMNKAKEKQQRGKVAKAKAKAKANGAKHGITNVASLHGTNVFRDIARNADLRDQPGFSKVVTTRKNALANLIASVPVGDQRIARGDNRLLEKSLSDFNGRGSCFPVGEGENSGWQLKGMNCTLKHYQVLGVAFMRRRENGTSEPRGGILADEMGLGKTIQMIANIINGKPDKRAEEKCTLIIASPALISQWYDEILKFTQFKKTKKNKDDGNDKSKHGLGAVIQHRAKHRIPGSEKQIIATIKKASVCLTTWGEVNKSYPKAVCPRELTTAGQKSEWWRNHFNEEKGIFHKIKFHRIVLDEAQHIKNHTGHASMACRALLANHYWAISGTPLMNGVKEMYAYLRFIRYPNAGSFKLFSENFCSREDPNGSEKLGVILRQFVIRRTHADTLFKAKLLDLPPPTQRVLYLEFNEVERSVYEIVKNRFIQRINAMNRREGVKSGYNHIWTMLLRLRQLCAHPLLIQDTILDLLEREDFEKLNQITEDTSDDSEETTGILSHLKHVLQDHVRAKYQDERPGHGQGQLEELTVVPGGVFESEGMSTDLGGKHGRNYQFHRLMKALRDSEQWDAINERKRCSSCRNPPAEPHITSCFHIYCHQCLMTIQHGAARQGKDHARCLECGAEFQSVKMLDEPIVENQPPAANGKTKKKKKDARPQLNWIGLNGEVLPSAKTIAAKAQILEWLSSDPTAKIIIYTQFIPMVTILAKVCETEGWGYCKYTGGMSLDAREKSIREFSRNDGEKGDEEDDDQDDEPEPKRILIASLKAGGLGLNIVAASRVIMLDPWWNDAVEQQAFCRVFRIGQVKETQLTRFCVKNTIDAAMFQVKERKIDEIEKVMESAKDQKTLTEEDLMKMFGPVGEDEEGHPFIFPEPYAEHDDDVPLFIDPDDGRGGLFGRPLGSDMGNEV